MMTFNNLRFRVAMVFWVRIREQRGFGLRRWPCALDARVMDDLGSRVFRACCTEPFAFYFSQLEETRLVRLSARGWTSAAIVRTVQPATFVPARVTRPRAPFLLGCGAASIHRHSISLPPACVACNRTCGTARCKLTVLCGPPATA